jgi:hypothetical protein
MRVLEWRWYMFLLYSCCYRLSVLYLQIYAMPVFDMIETVLVRKFWFRPGLMLRLIARTAYVGKCPTLRWTLQPSLVWRLAHQSHWINKTNEICNMCSVHDVCSHHLPLLQWIAQFLRWICFCANNLFRKPPPDPFTHFVSSSNDYYSSIHIIRSRIWLELTKSCLFLPASLHHVAHSLQT